MCNRNYLKLEGNLLETHHKIDGKIGDSEARAPWIILLGGLRHAPDKFSLFFHHLAQDLKH